MCEKSVPKSDLEISQEIALEAFQNWHKIHDALSPQNFVKHEVSKISNLVWQYNKHVAALHEALRLAEKEDAGQSLFGVVSDLLDKYKAERDALLAYATLIGVKS